MTRHVRVDLATTDVVTASFRELCDRRRCLRCEAIAGDRCAGDRDHRAADLRRHGSRRGEDVPRGREQRRVRDGEQRAGTRVLVHRGFVQVGIRPADVMIGELLRVDDLPRVLARVRGLGRVMPREQPDAQQGQRRRNSDDAFLHMRCKKHGSFLARTYAWCQSTSEPCGCVITLGSPGGSSGLPGFTSGGGLRGGSLSATA